MANKGEPIGFIDGQMGIIMRGHKTRSTGDMVDRGMIMCTFPYTYHVMYFSLGV